MVILKGLTLIFDKYDELKQFAASIKSKLNNLLLGSNAVNSMKWRCFVCNKMHLWGHSNDSEAIMMTLKSHICITNLIWRRVNECRTPTELIRTLEKGWFRVDLLITIIFDNTKIILWGTYLAIIKFMSVEHKNWTTLVFAHQWWLHLCSKQPSTRFMRLFYNLHMFDCFWASFLQYFWLFLKRIPLTVDCYERNIQVRDSRQHRFSSPFKKKLIFLPILSLLISNYLNNA